MSWTRAYCPPADYYRLQSHVARGDLRMIWIFGLPRTHSTAVEIALSESPSINGQLDAPLALSRF